MLFITETKSYSIRESKVSYIEYDKQLHILRIHLDGGRYLKIQTPVFFEDEENYSNSDVATANNFKYSCHEISIIWEKLNKVNYGEYHVSFSVVSMEVFNAIYVDGGNLDVCTSSVD